VSGVFLELPFGRRTQVPQIGADSLPTAKASLNADAAQRGHAPGSRTAATLLFTMERLLNSNASSCCLHVFARKAREAILEVSAAAVL